MKGDNCDYQYHVKWLNKSYSESTWEMEKDLISNKVEHKSQLASYQSRKVKPTMEDMLKQSKERDAQNQNLYKIFGDDQSSDMKEVMVKEYQDSLSARVFLNGGNLRDFQAEGVSWLLSNYINDRGSILADEMGLG